MLEKNKYRPDWRNCNDSVPRFAKIAIHGTENSHFSCLLHRRSICTITTDCVNHAFSSRVLHYEGKGQRDTADKMHVRRNSQPETKHNKFLEYVFHNQTRFKTRNGAMKGEKSSSWQPNVYINKVNLPTKKIL